MHIHEEAQSSDSVKAQSLRVFYESNPVALAIVLAISLGGPLLGLFLAGWIGVLLGVLLGIASLLLGPKAKTKVKEIRG
jgi:ABC-type nitrate/sulfonate/bicarbonate transport system permease component